MLKDDERDKAMSGRELIRRHIMNLPFEMSEEKQQEINNITIPDLLPMTSKFKERRE